MAPKNARKVEMSEDSASEDSINHIPKRLWVMHGAVMFGREFCYAMETALVTPVLLQLGLPEQYYSLTWFLSPILGLIFTPLCGSASDRCTLKWGRRRPFILVLCVGVLIGVALFLNGSLIGLSLGDVPSNQPVGIVLTVVGVVVLDFCADALDGPIRAYLLDVADTEEQDMALNIHAFSAGLGGALGYMLGGLDWTNTFLGRAFKAQEQVLFFFAAIIFIISTTLHLFSINEPHEDDRSEWDVSIDFLNDLVRSKSDSVLAMPDSTSKDGDSGTTVKLLWLSMLKMPPQLWRLCVCHLLSWFSMIAQAVFYTDFMGQVIFEGDPTAAANSTALQNYSKGVQMGCWGLVIYAATAALCSGVCYVHVFIKIIYMLGTLGYTVGTAIMSIFPNIYVAMVMISTMGIISMSMSYCPYALLGQYHEIKELLCSYYIHHSPGNSRRGFGIDCAILTCQVYISQILVASALGAIVDAVGTVRVIPMVAAGGAFLGFLAAAFLVIYPDTLDDEDDDDDEDGQGLSSVQSEAASSNSTEKLSVSKSMPRNSSCKLGVESTV
uniref:Solute carrier family 45 member 4-like n=1 Tax=Sinocyclocheilus rhinocerous TaxID=307959 RepID=A0A673N335_9TELE